MLCFVALSTLKDSSQWSVFEHHNVLNKYKYCEQTLFDSSRIFFPILLHIHHVSITQSCIVEGSTPESYVIIHSLTKYRIVSSFLVLWIWSPYATMRLLEEFARPTHKQSQYNTSGGHKSINRQGSTGIFACLVERLPR